MGRAILIVACCWLVVVAMVSPARAETLTIDQVIITPIERVDVPAPEAGVLNAVMVKEGDKADQGEMIARLDDRDAALAAKLAKAVEVTASHRAADASAVFVAEKRLQLSKQSVAEQEKSLGIALEQADNDIRVRAARKSRDVAKNELDRAKQARQAYADAVSASEIDGLRLAMERAELEAEQAAFDQQIDRMKAEAERETLATRKLGVEEADLLLKQAESEQQLARLQSNEAKVAVEQAMHAVERRGITSPISGHVLELMHRVGEWVEPGETLARLVRLDRLRGESFVSVNHLSSLKVGAPVDVIVVLGEGEERVFPGEISFVSKEVDPVNQQVSVWFDFDNPETQALPGMRARVAIETEERASREDGDGTSAG